jgi:hypothetical protein
MNDKEFNNPLNIKGTEGGKPEFLELNFLLIYSLPCQNCVVQPYDIAALSVIMV